ncbi:MAG: AAA family ATPase [Treponema sp.]|nr:AAA family ATPase [Treponema sp.]
MEISPQLRKILSVSFSNAKDAHHEFFTPEHILSTALLVGDVKNLLESFGADTQTISSQVNEYIKKNVPVISGKSSINGNSDPIETKGFHEVMNRAVYHCASSDKQVLDIYDVLVSMTEEERSYCAYSLKLGGVDRIRLIEAITSNWHQVHGTEQENTTKTETQTSSLQAKTLLDKFCTELVSLAKAGQLDELIGREEEIERTIQILCRRTKNNPLYIGEAGVGKTALANGLAIRIAKGDVPDFLKDFSIYSLDITSLLAGTRYRGDFEDRMSKITNELIKIKKAILFIDEIHTILGAGAGSNSILDAANSLKPVLSTGKVRCIGSTTYDEYTKKFEKDRALVRRFQKIDVPEPSKEDSLLILQGVRKKYEDFHNVVYSDNVLKLAVDLSVQYIPDRRLPDKAIDIIDEVGSYCKIQTKAVSDEIVKKVVAKIAQVPLETVNNDEKEKLKSLEKTLKKEIFGQDAAVELVSTAVKKARAGFNNPEKPEACFLFVGPTGVGKTELTRALSNNLSETLLRYDMSEYQEEYTISRLIGASPGYVGYEEGGQLTEDVRKNPHSIILFDEIEKAHPKIYNVLLQVLDYGTLTDNQGRKADFKNCIIIMTSNAGARDMEKGAIGFGVKDFLGEDGVLSWEGSSLKEAVEKEFSPEFRNRLDAVVPFAHLGKEVVKNIAKKEIEKLAIRLATKNINLKVSDKAIVYLSNVGYSKEFGARNMARTIEQYIASPLTDEVLFGKLSSGGSVNVACKNEKIFFTYDTTHNAFEEA